jgi:hypothetical protein
MLDEDNIVQQPLPSTDMKNPEYAGIFHDKHLIVKHEME